jgi:23S rRNA (uracil1939-C5)-methyltransferase
VRIEKLVAGGLGLARTERGVALIAGALPRELVEARLETSKGALKGTVERIIQPSPARVEVDSAIPPTADLAHAKYDAQLEFKHGFVTESLARIAKLEAEVLPTKPSPLEWAYRNTAQYMVTPAGVGYRLPNSHRAFLVRSDPLVTELISDGLPLLNGEKLEPIEEIAFRASFATGEVLACIIGKQNAGAYPRAVRHLRDLGVAGISYAFVSQEGRFRGGIEHLWGQQHMLERYGEYNLTITASSFAQVNPQAATELYLAVSKLAGKGGDAIDLYGGSGALGFHLDFERVTVLEINPEAVAGGQRDAQRLGLKNVNFLRGDATRLAGLFADVITLDPPRAGLSKDALEAVVMTRASKVVYVSCDPATWARDVARLVKSGYRLTHVQPWDFYPQTSHVEVLSVLER